MEGRRDKSQHRTGDAWIGYLPFIALKTTIAVSAEDEYAPIDDAEDRRIEGTESEHANRSPEHSGDGHRCEFSVPKMLSGLDKDKREGDDGYGVDHNNHRLGIEDQ